VNNIKILLFTRLFWAIVCYQMRIFSTKIIILNLTTYHKNFICSKNPPIYRIATIFMKKGGEIFSLIHGSKQLLNCFLFHVYTPNRPNRSLMFHTHTQKKRRKLYEFMCKCSVSVWKPCLWQILSNFESVISI